MPTRCKITIQDDDLLREKIDTIYEILDQRETARWALNIARRIANLINIDYTNNKIISK